MTVSRRYGLTVVVALLIAVYTMSHSSKFHIVDEVSLFAVTESIAERGELDTNAVAWTQWVNSPGEVLGAFGQDGQVYSKKGPAPAVLAVPWYLVLLAASKLTGAIGLLQGTLLWNGLLTALTAALLWLTAVRLGYDDRAGALLSVLFGLCTIAWPYANQFFGEPLSGLALLLALYGFLAWHQEGRLRWPLLAGVGAGLAIATVTAHAALVVVLAVYGFGPPVRTAWRGWRSGESDMRAVWRRMLWAAGVFLIPVFIAGAGLLWYNAARFGNPLATGYHFDSGEGFTTPLFTGLYGLLISPYRGVFWFTPLFVASIASLIAFARRYPLEAAATGAASVALILVYSLWWMWWGGFAWGPRFLVPLAAFWVLWLAPVAARVTRGVWRGAYPPPAPSRRARLARLGWQGWGLLGLAALSFGVQVLAVSVNFVNYEIYLRSIYPTDWLDPHQFGPPAMALSALADSPIFGQWMLLRTDFAANSNFAWLWPDGNLQLFLIAFGVAVLCTLGGLFVSWWLSDERDGSGTPSRPVRWLAATLPVLLIAVWLGEVAHNPHYGDPEHGYRKIVSDICALAQPNDAVITVAPFAYQIPMNWMGSECRYGVPIYGYAANSMEFPEADEVLTDALASHDRIWFVTGGLPPNDPENSVERWLAERAYKANDTWYDDFRLLDYGVASSLEGAPLTSINKPLVGEQTSEVMVVGARWPQASTPGGVMPVELTYRLAAPSDQNLRWFVQMLTLDGYPVALLDTAPLDSYATFKELPAGEDLVEMAGLELPADLPPGQYRMIAGLYNPDVEGAPRLRAPDGSDFVELGYVFVD